MTEPCRLCGSTAPLVNSHTVPKALHLDAQQLEKTGEVMQVYTDLLNYGRNSPTGEYDRIVCDECEKRFQPWDDYGINFVRTYKSGTVGQPVVSSDPTKASDPAGLIISDIDYTKLKLFVLSMLWRANASSRVMFKRIDLSAEQRGQLTQAILNADPGPAQFFAVAASLFKSDSHKTFLMDPHPEKYADIEHVRFYVYGGFTFLIKIDSRDSPDFLRPMVLQPEEPFGLILRDLSPSERQAIANILASK